MSGDRRVDVKARLSGVFYRAVSPEADAFVEIGSEVDEGQTVALLESMKLFMKVKAPSPGTVVEILVDNETAVNAGQVLLRIAGDS